MKNEKNARVITRLLHLQIAHLSSHGTSRRIPVVALLDATISPAQTTVSIDIPLFVLVTAAGVIAPGLLHGPTSVPAQGTTDTVEPFAVTGDHCREGVLAGFNGDIVALPELNAAFAVEGAICGRTRRHRYCNTEQG